MQVLRDNLLTNLSDYMGTQVKNQSGSGTIRILVVSPNYRNFTGFENFGLDVVEIEDLYSRKIERNGEEFGKKFIIEKFFSVRNRDFTDLKDFISSRKYDIIHFSMHSLNSNVFFTENDLISYDRFISAFEYSQGTQAVLLNICNSAEMAEKIAGNVPIVLGCEGKLTVEKARDICTSFYTPLFNDYPVSDCFTRLKKEQESNCKIFINSGRLSDQSNPGSNGFNYDIIKKTGSENHPVSETKKPSRKILPAISTLLILFLLVITGIFLIKNRKDLSPGPVSDSLQIISPVSGSEVIRKSDFIISAKLRPGGIPWLFVLPPAGKEWWPQFQGHLTGNGNWEIPVQIGNEIDSGQFTIVAMVIKDQIADEMKAWLASQGTLMQSNPLSNEILKSFFWYASDTVKVSRIIE